MEAFIIGIGWVSKESMGYNGCIKKFDPTTALPELKRNDILSHPYNHFGRMDNFSKLGFAGIVFAMKDAGIKIGPDTIESGKTESNTINPGKQNISMIASTVTGCLETDLAFQKTMSRPLPSPAIFAYTLDSSFLGEASIYLGLTGESFVINESKPDGLKGLFMALEIIDSGVSDIVLCGTCNSDIKTTNSDFCSNTPGSVFLVLQRKSLYSYGMIKANSMKSCYFQNKIRLNTLYDLAQHCTNRKKSEMDKYEHDKD